MNLNNLIVLLVLVTTLAATSVVPSVVSPVVSPVAWTADANRDKTGTTNRYSSEVRSQVEHCTALASRVSFLAEGMGFEPTTPCGVFCNSTGGPLRRTHFHVNHFKPLLTTAGLPDIRFHDLRHTSATLLLAAGVHPKVVQERLGHSQIGITLDTYSHVVPTMQLEAATRLDAVMRRSASKAKGMKARGGA